MNENAIQDRDHARDAAEFLRLADEEGGWLEEVSDRQTQWYIERCHAHAQAAATLALVVEQQQTNELLAALLAQRIAE